MVTSQDRASRWLFPAERLSNTPSIRRGMSEQEELNQRQYTACLIRKIGLKLKESCRKPSGLCIDTAMVYMHRFYVFHSFQKYPPATMAPCCLFLAAKVEETPVKLGYVIRTTYMLQNPSAPSNSLVSKLFEEQQRELIANENLLLQTLGFDLIVQHPHTSVIKSGDKLGASRAVIKFAYDLATNSLHFTTMCLRHKPTTVACICLITAFKGFSLGIKNPPDGSNWWDDLDENLDQQTVNELTKEFVEVMRKHGKAFNKWVSVKSHQTDSVEPSTTRTSSTVRATSSNNLI